ncbi:MAG: hypothetical protein LUD27_02475 [Clostridia bacterium]|nr:hypothetical protein [Clostridia bacterium]
MVTIDYDFQYFNPKDVLECGQIFRFSPYKDGYKVFSADKACYVYADGGKTFIECDDGDYFYNFFDLGRDYASINAIAMSYDVPLLQRGCALGRGLRLLNQNAEEMIYSFIISQNNNIPRIKGIIERICSSLGEEREFSGEKYYTFPSSKALSSAGKDFFRQLGAGYRDDYLAKTSARVAAEGIDGLYKLGSRELKARLLTYTGIGPKVADCISLFGFGRRECFPVDTWIEKLYREDFGGTLKDRNKINEYFCNLFGENAGYMQQYLFYAKRENFS